LHRVRLSTGARNFSRRVEKGPVREVALQDQRVNAKRLVWGLDARELEVLRCIVRGNSDRSIAAVKGISIAAVEGFRNSMMRKLLARTTADAVRIGLLAEVDRGD
jgi:FixJ family two-component response regulator